MKQAYFKLRSICIGWWRFLFESRSEIGSDRMAICKKCPFRKGYLCGKCGCVLGAKVESVNEQCPEGMWPNVSDF